MGLSVALVPDPYRRDAESQPRRHTKPRPSDGRARGRNGWPAGASSLAGLEQGRRGVSRRGGAGRVGVSA